MTWLVLTSSQSCVDKINSVTATRTVHVSKAGASVTAMRCVKAPKWKLQGMVQPIAAVYAGIIRALEKVTVIDMHLWSDPKPVTRLRISSHHTS